MTVLVTGGAGFIGSNLARKLLEQGAEVIILDNFNDYYDPALKRANVTPLMDRAKVVEGDIRDENLVEALFSQNKITGVAHLAAMAGVRSSVDEGVLYADVNLTGSVVLMNASRKHGVDVFVQASTSSVYGQAKKIPFVEDEEPDFPLAPYPASKRAAEIFAYSYHQLFGLNVNILRFFNVYGPGGRPDMMPLIALESILLGREIPMFDGGALERDWTYIDDVVDGVIAALNRPLGYQVFNLGRGRSIALTSFIEIYEKLIGKAAVTRSVPAPLTEPRITFCDNTKAAELLGFDPKVDLEEGLANTWDWYKKHYKL